MPDDPEKFDLNLDDEPIAESPEELAAAAEAAVRRVAGAAPAVGEQLGKLQAEKEELLNTLIRRQADFENYKKRMERERVEDRSRAYAVMIEGLLPVLDGFERALKAHGDSFYEEHRKGFELIYRQLLEGLARYGLEPIEALGKPFDPHLHHAVERVESAEHDDGTVVEEHVRGYMLGAKVLRPSMVRVAFKPGKPDG